MNEHDLPQAMWQKSSYSNGQANCVEVARNLSGIVAIRDSKDPMGGMLRMSREEWKKFLSQMKK